MLTIVMELQAFSTRAVWSEGLCMICLFMAPLMNK